MLDITSDPGTPMESITSSRYSGRVSRSSVREDFQLVDEYRRKQRVVRYMQEERERAARTKLLRREHEEWISLRAKEREERLKYLTEEEVAELLRREAAELEMEKQSRGSYRSVGSVSPPLSGFDRRRRRGHPAVPMASLLSQYSTASEHAPAPVGEARERRVDAQRIPPTAKPKSIRVAHKATEVLPIQRIDSETQCGETDGQNGIQHTAHELELEQRLKKLKKEKDWMEEQYRLVENILQEREQSLALLSSELTQERKEKENSQRASAEKENEVRQHLIEVARLSSALEEQEKKHASDMHKASMLAHPKKFNEHEPILASPLETKKQAKKEDQKQRLKKELELLRAQVSELETSLQQEMEARARFEELAASAVANRGTKGSAADSQKLVKEVERYQREAESARAETQAVRDNAEREIQALKAWCAQLEERREEAARKLKSRPPSLKPLKARTLQNEQSTAPAKKTRNPPVLATPRPRERSHDAVTSKKITELSQELAATRDKLNLTTRENTSLNLEVSTLRERIKNLGARRRSSDEKRPDGPSAEQTARLDQLTAANGALERERDELHRTCAELQAAVEESARREDESRRSIAALHTRHAELQAAAEAERARGEVQRAPGVDRATNTTAPVQTKADKKAGTCCAC